MSFPCSGRPARIRTCARDAGERDPRTRHSGPSALWPSKPARYTPPGCSVPPSPALVVPGAHPLPRSGDELVRRACDQTSATRTRLGHGRPYAAVASRRWPDTREPLPAGRTGALTCGFAAHVLVVAGVGFEPT